MTDYFGYDVHFVMNITDIDDKVCASTSHLCCDVRCGNGSTRGRQRNLSAAHTYLLTLFP